MSNELTTTPEQFDGDHSNDNRAHDRNPLGADRTEVVGEPALGRGQPTLGQCTGRSLLTQLGYRIDKGGPGALHFSLQRDQFVVFMDVANLHVFTHPHSLTRSRSPGKTARVCTLDSLRTLAGVVELADTQVLGTCVFGRAGSSPASRTLFILAIKIIEHQLRRIDPFA